MYYVRAAAVNFYNFIYSAQYSRNIESNKEVMNRKLHHNINSITTTMCHTSNGTRQDQYS